MELNEAEIMFHLAILPDQTYVATNGVKLYISHHRVDDPMVMVSQGDQEWIGLKPVIDAVQELLSL